ncbi:hypothetical protein, partial [Aeromonas caviae]|uniref:hypothetical protein n=1 Tax=Aeromonas caviae TaxID=648 RepID=UPI001CC5E9DD
MRHIETATLRGYAAHLIARLEQGEISPASRTGSSRTARSPRAISMTRLTAESAFWAVAGLIS